MEFFEFSAERARDLKKKTLDLLLPTENHWGFGVLFVMMELSVWYFALTQWTAETTWKIWKIMTRRCIIQVLFFNKTMQQSTKLPSSRNYLQPGSRTFWNGLHTVQTWTPLKISGPLSRKDCKNKCYVGNFGGKSHSTLGGNWCRNSQLPS